MPILRLGLSWPYLLPLMKWAKRIFTPLALITIAWFIWQSWAEVSSRFIEADRLKLLVASVIWIGTHFFSPLITVFSFKACGNRITYWNALHIHCSRLPAKYLPGGIWHSIGRASDYLSLGHTGGQLGYYFLLENFLLIAVSFSFGALLVHRSIENPSIQYFFSAIPIAGLAVICVFPAVVHWLSKRSMSIKPRAYIASVIAQVCYWYIAGVAFALYIYALSPANLNASVSELAGVFIFSWSVGYMAIFAPQGIGVTELVSGMLLNGSAQVGNILGLLVGFRIMVLFSDLATWVLTALLRQDR